MTARPQLLLAIPPSAQDALLCAGEDLDCVMVETFGDAARELLRRPFDLIVVGYFFDSGQPFRFIQYARAHCGGTPIILVRALGRPLGTASASEIRAAYQQLGANDFYNFRAEADRLGIEEARRLFREAVFRWLPKALATNVDSIRRPAEQP